MTIQLIRLPLVKSLADPMHIIRLSAQYGDATIHFGGTRWQRLLIWLLQRTLPREVPKGPALPIGQVTTVFQ